MRAAAPQGTPPIKAASVLLTLKIPSNKIMIRAAGVKVFAIFRGVVNISKTTSAAARHEARNATKIRHRLTKEEFRERISVSSFFFNIYVIFVKYTHAAHLQQLQEVTLPKKKQPKP